MAGTCGGTVTTQTLTVNTTASQVLGADDSRTRVTIQAASTNAFPVYLLGNGSDPYRNGFPLQPGAAYEFTDRGARVALYCAGPHSGAEVIYVITEGA